MKSDAMPPSCLTFSLLALLASPEEACVPESTVAIEVVSELADERDDAAMREFVTTRLPAPAAAQGVCVAPDASQRVVVTIAWSNAARGNYALHLSATSPEHREPIEIAGGTCDGCGTPEIVDRIASQLPDVIAALAIDAPTANEPIPNAPSIANAAVSPLPSRALAMSPQRPPITALGKAGIAVGVLGIATLATGATLWAKDPIAYDPDPRYRIAYRSVGISIAVTGIAATIGGAAMLAEDLRRGRAVALVPTVARHHAGLALRGRF
jgi:hypothetical protein